MRTQRPSASSSSAWPEASTPPGWSACAAAGSGSGASASAKCVPRTSESAMAGKKSRRCRVGQHDRAVGRHQDDAFARGLQRVGQPVFRRAAQARSRASSFRGYCPASPSWISAARRFRRRRRRGIGVCSSPPAMRSATAAAADSGRTMRLRRNRVMPPASSKRQQRRADGEHIDSSRYW